MFLMLLIYFEIDENIIIKNYNKYVNIVFEDTIGYNRNTVGVLVSLKDVTKAHSVRN